MTTSQITFKPMMLRALILGGALSLGALATSVAHGQVLPPQTLFDLMNTPVAAATAKAKGLGFEPRTLPPPDTGYRTYEYKKKLSLPGDSPLYVNNIALIVNRSNTVEQVMYNTRRPEDIKAIYAYVEDTKNFVRKPMKDEDQDVPANKNNGKPNATKRQEERSYTTRRGNLIIVQKRIANSGATVVQMTIVNQKMDIVR